MNKAIIVACVSTFAVCAPISAQAGDPYETKEATDWVDCLRNYADRHSPSSVDAETIATGAVGNCRSHDHAVLELASKRPTALRFILGPLTREERNDVREDHERLRQGLREQIIAYVLENRLEAGTTPSLP
ncbi:hypothetical protein [Brevundimonas sp.]|uniref:hypothetical protein n=1 Tax=Brevundimonas sp. TaxID=1871086 RepID=UPI002FC71B52